MLEAIVLVGGEGTRLRPLTLTTPKPLLPVAGVPFLAHQFARARDAGVTRIVLATSYRAELFEQVFGDGSDLGIELVYVTEVEPLGTGGAIGNVAEALISAPNDPVVILNGDVLSGHDLAAQLRLHRDADADVTLHLVRVDDARAFGCVPTTDDGRVTDFLEKMPEPVTDQVNAGCYVFKRAVIDAIPKGRPVSVERETFPALLADGSDVRGYVETAYWLDLGTPAAFIKGATDLTTGVIASSALPGPCGDALILDGAKVDESATVSGGSVIGRRTIVDQRARIEHSILFDDVNVAPGVTLSHSIIGAGSTIGEGAQLTNSVIGDGETIEAGAVLNDERVPA